MNKMKELIKKLLAPFMGTIKKGPLRGKKWILASGVRFVQGRYETDTVEILKQYIKPGQTVYDVGAHIGYLTIVMSELVGPEGKVVAFEPRPLNLIYLKKHLQKNNINNVRIIEAGVSDTAGAGKFDADHGTGTGRVSTDGSLDIELVTLDDLIASKQVPPPSLIKMDIEGGEMEALPGAKILLTEYKPIIVLSTHGDKVHDVCKKFLANIGYNIENEDRSGFIAN